MDAQPTIVLNDALGAGKADLSRAGSAISAVLVEQLANEPHYAEFEIRVTGTIVDPGTGATVATVDLREPYRIYWDRDPNSADQTE